MWGRVWLGVVLLAGCGGSAKQAQDAGAAPRPFDWCALEAKQPLGCLPHYAAAVPFGPTIKVGTRTSEPPAPTFGTLHDGDYQLVSETIYGFVPPESRTGLFASRRAVLDVRCDEFDEIIDISDPVIEETGTDCGRLVPRTVSLAGVAGIDPPAPNVQTTEIMYSVSDTTLTLYHVWPYQYELFTVSVYTIVDRFTRVGSEMADAGEPPASDASIAKAPHDPRCPLESPQHGDPCMSELGPLQCEYARDAWHQCTTIARCALQADSTFRFELDSDTNCQPNAALCPSSFLPEARASSGDADGGDGDACSDPSQSCHYPEGSCACLYRKGASQLTWICRARDEVSASPDGAPPCPTLRPLAGDACPSEGETCRYDAHCQNAPSLGPWLECQSGYWKRYDGDFECPALSP